MKISNTKQARGNSYMIETKTSAEFLAMIHRIESGGYRWWRLHSKSPGPHYKIETNMNPDQNDLFPP